MKGVGLELLPGAYMSRKGAVFGRLTNLDFIPEVMGAIDGTENFEVDLYFKSCIREEVWEASKQPGQ